MEKTRVTGINKSIVWVCNFFFSFVIFSILVLILTPFNYLIPCRGCSDKSLWSSCKASWPLWLIFKELNHNEHHEGTKYTLKEKYQIIYLSDSPIWLRWLGQMPGACPGIWVQGLHCGLYQFIEDPKYRNSILSTRYWDG